MKMNSDRLRFTASTAPPAAARPRHVISATSAVPRQQYHVSNVTSAVPRRHRLSADRDVRAFRTQACTRAPWLGCFAVEALPSTQSAGMAAQSLDARERDTQRTSPSTAKAASFRSACMSKHSAISACVHRRAHSHGHMRPSAREWANRSGAHQQHIQSTSTRRPRPPRRTGSDTNADACIARPSIKPAGTAITYPGLNTLSQLSPVSPSADSLSAALSPTPGGHAHSKCESSAARLVSL